jgi:hypothetical protein
MSQLQPRFGAMQIAIIVLTIITALVHLYLAIFQMDFDLLFILNGLGYLGLLGLLYLPIPMVAPYRNVVRWVLIVFAAVTVVAWLLIGTRDIVAYVTKVVEVVLIILLYLEGQQTQA